MFVLGTAAHSRDYRMSAGGFVHGFRYTGKHFTSLNHNISGLKTYEAIIRVLCFATTVRAVHKILEQRYHNIAWPATELPISQLQSWILRRVNEASGPYQMIGVLGDIILLRG